MNRTHGEDGSLEHARRVRLAEMVGRVARARKLSPRIEQVLSAWLTGDKAEASAHALGISVHTFRSYKRRLYREFEVSSRMDLMHAVTEIAQRDAEDRA